MNGKRRAEIDGVQNPKDKVIKLSPPREKLAELEKFCLHVPREIVKYISSFLAFQDKKMLRLVSKSIQKTLDKNVLAIGTEVRELDQLQTVLKDDNSVGKISIFLKGKDIRSFLSKIPQEVKILEVIFEDDSFDEALVFPRHIEKLLLRFSLRASRVFSQYSFPSLISENLRILAITNLAKFGKVIDQFPRALTHLKISEENLPPDFSIDQKLPSSLQVLILHFTGEYRVKDLSHLKKLEYLELLQNDFPILPPNLIELNCAKSPIKNKFSSSDLLKLPRDLKVFKAGVFEDSTAAIAESLPPNLTYLYGSLQSFPMKKLLDMLEEKKISYFFEVRSTGDIFKKNHQDLQPQTFENANLFFKYKTLLSH